MTEAIFIVFSLLLGLGLGWYAGSLRGRSSAAGESAGLQSALTEVRGQLAAKEAEILAARQAVEIEKVSGADAKARLESAREHFAEQKRQIAEMETKVKETFGALSAAALKSNNEQFVTLADAKLKPLREQLERYEKQIKELEETRAKAYGGLSEKLTAVQQGADQLKSETSQLVAALRSPGAKGKWGEVTLQRIVELAGLVEHCDFETQAAQASGGRPDLVVHLPGGRTLAVDAKVNTGAYLDAIAATDEDIRKRHLQRYASDVRGTLKNLGSREYWKQFTPAPELVIMFVPGEAFFATALTQDSDLLTDGIENHRVLLASPTTLIALLYAVRHGWQQQQIADNAQRIADAGRELYDRLCTFVTHLDTIRDSIEKAAQAYNKVVGNWTGRTLPAAKKLQELGAAEAGKILPDLRIVEEQMRTMPPADILPMSPAEPLPGLRVQSE